MATVEKTVSILFFGDDQLSAKITGIQKSFDTFTGKVGAIAAPLAGVADKILAVNAALMVLAAGGLVYAFTKSVDYEQATIELQKVMGDTETITKDLEDQFTSLSREYGTSTTDIISSLAELRQSGYTTAEGMEILNISLQLSRASELEVEDATNLLKRALIGYNLEVKDARTLGDLWNHTSQVSNTNVTELAEAFAIVSRQASDAGFSLSETAAILTPIIGVFGSGSEAGTAFSTALSRMLDPTKEAEAAIRMLTGVTGPLKEEFADGKELFEAVAIGLQKVDDRTGAVAIAQIVGINQAKRIKIAFDDYREALEKIGPAANQYNSLQKEVDLQNASSKASVDRLIFGFESLAVTIGTQFRDAASEAIDGGTDIENALEDIIKDGTFAPIFDALSDFGIELGDYLKGIAKAMPEAFEGVDFTGLIDAFGDLFNELGLAFDGLDLTKPEDLKIAIQFVVDSLESLVKITEGMVGPLGIFFGKIIDGIEAFNSFNDSTKTTTGATLGWAKAIDIIIGPLGTLLKALNVLAIGVTSLVGIKVAGFLATFAGVSAIVVPAGIALGITAVAASLGILIGKAAESVGIFDFIDKLFPSDLPDRIATTKDEFETLEDTIREINDALDGLDDAVEAKAKGDIKSMLIENYSALEIQYAITGDLSDLEAVLDEAGVLIKEKEPVIDIDTTEAEQKVVELNEIIEEKLPSEKWLEIKLKGEIDTEIARIETQGETAQTAMEWTAKLNIAEAEANAKIFEASVAGISTIIENTGGSLTSLFGLLADADSELGVRATWNLEDQIEEESRMRKDAHEEMMKLSEAQREYMEARTEALESGDALIEIKADGLEPEISAFMWKILEKIQIRANESNAEFLLGI